SPQAPPQGAKFSTHTQQILDICSALTRCVENLEHDKAAQKLEIFKPKARVKRLEGLIRLNLLRRMIDDLDKYEGIKLVKDADIAKTEGRHAAKQAEKHAKIYHLDLDHPSKVLNVITAASQVSAASATISAAKPSKGILVETPKPMKKKDQIELDAEEDQVVLKSINETLAQKAAKRTLNEEAQEAKDLKKRLEVVDDEDDDVFIKATPLARKVPVVDYQIVLIDNKPRFKIIEQMKLISCISAL
nr:hypothetical protein [Tanacetum cinerariifolium]